jgi:hypothetical protein
MEVARLSAEASQRLTDAQKSELITKLPFGEATFSKLVQIGTDTRLHTKDVQRLLPPHYTTIYSVTLLEHHELKLAMSERIISPEMKRAGLQKWVKSCREEREVGVIPGQKDAASNAGVSIAPATVESGFVPVQNQQERQEELRSDLTHDTAIEERPATAPAVKIPALPDLHPLTPDERLALDSVMAAWATSTELRAALVEASSVVREHFVAAVHEYIASASSPAM